MPPRTDPRTHESRSVTAWYGKLRHWQLRPNPTDKVLWEQVPYKPRKHKQKTKRTPPTPQQMHDKRHKCTSMLQQHWPPHTIGRRGLSHGNVHERPSTNRLPRGNACMLPPQAITAAPLGSPLTEGTTKTPPPKKFVAHGET